MEASDLDELDARTRRHFHMPDDIQGPFVASVPKELGIRLAWILVVVARNPKNIGLGNVGEGLDSGHPKAHFVGASDSHRGPVPQLPWTLRIACGLVSGDDDFCRRGNHRIDVVHETRVEIDSDHARGYTGRGIEAQVGIAEQNHQGVSRSGGIKAHCRVGVGEVTINRGGGGAPPAGPDNPRLMFSRDSITKWKPSQADLWRRFDANFRGRATDR